MNNSRLIELDKNEINPVIYLHYFIVAILILAAFSSRIADGSLATFPFLFELLALGFIFRYHFISLRNRNFIFWFLNLVVGLYFLRIFLQYTLFAPNLFLIYLSTIGLISILVSSFVMSSPLYFPRVQWWEYDFRYRGDLKGNLVSCEGEPDIRLIDLRRQCCSFEVFERLNMNDHVTLQVFLNKKIYTIPGVIKSVFQEIPGRQIRYGVRIDGTRTDYKNNYRSLQVKWNRTKKVKIRNKFKDK